MESELGHKFIEKSCSLQPIRIGIATSSSILCKSYHAKNLYTKCSYVVSFARDIILLAMQYAKCKHEILYTSDGAWGLKDNKTGLWTGMFGDLKSRRIDLTTPLMDCVPNRLAEFKYLSTITLWSDDYLFFSEKETDARLNGILHWWRPLPVYLWICLYFLKMVQPQRNAHLGEMLKAITLTLSYFVFSNTLLFFLFQCGRSFPFDNLNGAAEAINTRKYRLALFEADLHSAAYERLIAHSDLSLALRRHHVIPVKSPLQLKKMVNTNTKMFYYGEKIDQTELVAAPYPLITVMDKTAGKYPRLAYISSDFKHPELVEHALLMVAEHGFVVWLNKRFEVQMNKLTYLTNNRLEVGVLKLDQIYTAFVLALAIELFGATLKVLSCHLLGNYIKKHDHL